MEGEGDPIENPAYAPGEAYEHFVALDTLSIFTVRRSALHGLCDRNSVRLSVCSSACHTRALCPHGLTYDHDYFTIW